MKTEAELKKLAEFGAEFLGWERGCESFFTPFYLHIVLDKHLSKEAYVSRFFSGLTAPILADLAKREMEERGWDWTTTYVLASNQYFAEFVKKKLFIWGADHDENEYIALWSAIEATGEK